MLGPWEQQEYADAALARHADPAVNGQEASKRGFLMILKLIAVSVDP